MKGELRKLTENHANNVLKNMYFAVDDFAEIIFLVRIRIKMRKK